MFKLLPAYAITKFASGSGSDTLVFTAPAGSREKVAQVDLHGGAIIATEAAATLRVAKLSLPN